MRRLVKIEAIRPGMLITKDTPNKNYKVIQTVECVRAFNVQPNKVVPFAGDKDKKSGFKDVEFALVTWTNLGHGHPYADWIQTDCIKRRYKEVVED